MDPRALRTVLDEGTVPLLCSLVQGVDCLAWALAHGVLRGMPRLVVNALLEQSWCERGSSGMAKVGRCYQWTTSGRSRGYGRLTVRLSGRRPRGSGEVVAFGQVWRGLSAQRPGFIGSGQLTSRRAAALRLLTVSCRLTLPFARAHWAP